MMGCSLPLYYDQTDKLFSGLTFSSIRNLNRLDKINRSEEHGQDSANDSFGVYSSFNYDRFPGVRFSDFTRISPDLDPIIKRIFPKFYTLYVTTFMNCPNTHLKEHAALHSKVDKTNLICVYGSTRFTYDSQLSEDDSFEACPKPPSSLPLPSPTLCSSPVQDSLDSDCVDKNSTN